MTEEKQEMCSCSEVEHVRQETCKWDKEIKKKFPLLKSQPRSLNILKNWIAEVVAKEIATAVDKERRLLFAQQINESEERAKIILDRTKEIERERIKNGVEKLIGIAEVAGYTDWANGYENGLLEVLNLINA